MLYSFSNFYTREEIIHWIISLILNIFPNCGFIESNRTHIITFCSEMPIPKLITFDAHLTERDGLIITIKKLEFRNWKSLAFLWLRTILSKARKTTL